MGKSFGFIALFLFMLPNMGWTKQQCQSYLNKFRQVQALQRQGHSNKQARTLASREQKARDQWWQCKQGKLKPKSKRKVSHKKSQPNTPRVYHDPQAKPLTSYTNEVVIKGAFSGKKQQDWLDFYQPLAKCKRPRSTQEFAYCMEERRRQQQVFEQQYQK
ncbi:hypothetical protein [Thalassotalea sp. G2M2-11]|uniref:hypothetical protein n=1 Tax=Thalassotalea sp. G2M2-11 TaxID=2787627 RepID=UPI0019D1EB32|nr:hypothetical protein [Thalassotalea sp. G2M2-11]